MRRLSDLYPDYRIDVAAEQAALVAADIVVLQYPTYWFNTPAILKKWLDDVWTYGFAYDTGGKKLFVSTTTGAPQEEYDGSTTPLIADLVKPVEASALYAGFACTVSNRATEPSTFRAYTATLIRHKSRRVPTITPATSARKSSNCGKRSHVTKKQPFRLLFYDLWHQRQGIKGFPVLPPQERVVAQVAAVWLRGFLMLARRVLAANRGGCCCLLAGWRTGYLRIFSGVAGFAG